MKVEFACLLIFVLVLNKCIGDLPELETVKEMLKESELFSPEGVEDMCKIQNRNNGLCSWETGIDGIYNSELSEEEQIKPLALLLALGILQIEANDQQLIEDLRSEMAKWSDEDKVRLRDSKMGFSFEDLNSVFKAKSAPTTPVDSDDD